MNQEERQLLQGLFDRLQGNANQQREPEAERFIADQIRRQPGAPYYMAQAIVVQEQALQQSSDRIAELEDRVQQLEAAGQPRASGQGGFLARSTGGMFGRGTPQPEPSRSAVPSTGGPWGRTSTPQAQAQPQQVMQAPMQAPASGGGGGGFLKGALGTAAGVVGGALIYDQVKGMFGGGSGAAHASTPSTPANQGENDRALDEAQDSQDDNDSSFDSDSGDVET